MLSRRSDEHNEKRARNLSSRCAKSPRDIAPGVALKNLNAAFGLAGAKFKLNRGEQEGHSEGRESGGRGPEGEGEKVRR